MKLKKTGEERRNREKEEQVRIEERNEQRRMREEERNYEML